MADAEVHLKLVKAHLAALTAMELLETGPFETATPPPFEPTSNEAGTDQEGATLGENGSPTARPGAGPRSGGVDPMARRPAWERGSIGLAPSASARNRQLTPWMSARSSRTYRSPRGRGRSRSGIAVSAASWTVETGRPAAGATVESDSVGTTCWGWCRRQGQTRPGVRGVGSNDLGGKPPREARTPPEEGPTRTAAGAVEAKGSHRKDRQTCGAFPRSARIRSWCGSEPPGVST
jgi:hypothetical protein